jgi:septum site-determining protein MinD
MTRVIGIFSGKGGVGKTTAAVNIGAALAYDFDKNVTVIDTNTSSSCLSLHLGMQYSPLTVNHLLKKEAKYEDVVETHGSGMKVIPASIRLNDSFVDMSNLPKVVKQASENSEIVLLDTAPSIGSETLWSLKSCDEAVIVTNPDLPSVVEALKMIKLAEEHDVEVVGLVLNKMRKKNSLTTEEIERICNIDVIAKVPLDFSVEDSIKQNIPIVHNKPFSKSSLAMKELAARLVGMDYKPTNIERFRSVLGV